MIAIIDYGMGNLGSIVNILRKAGAAAVLASSAVDVGKANKIILPGIGSFDHAMQRLQELRLVDALHHKVTHEKAPVLGICLGLQLLGNRSEEGSAKGFGWIDAETRKFQVPNAAPTLKIPHMGWNTVKPRPDTTLFHGLDDEARFYFVHSYRLVCADPADVLATTEYGEEFVLAVRKENIFGVQFHPEKSHRYGLTLLRNFAEL